ncbi:zwei Ig domain protein zig-8 isoform X6 [Bactrocera dorsalis]|uniref:Zwei Ig domain protein zig-8 isoform X6 n=1 Tax=Bactrocera dorsalis TaxID=27457 RepID=A0A034VLE9_BACDO|nr:zwei Ig domain protein zig-8 isoform X6 [Bactrocera dorsalis]XP_049316452.1 zwei Ig domain protein zig-8 isoform X6 [Bactrocera dorsalis]XP_049316453.1 zwei Ig domain protein zig-8 isoform X6 [Bactrocera dorsalis]
MISYFLKDILDFGVEKSSINGEIDSMISAIINNIRLQPFLYLILHIYLNHIQSTSQSSLNDFITMERPYFDDISPRNVSTVADEPAILKCRVRNKGNRTVSWMRKRDLHILTTNIYTYTGDQRFSILHPPGGDDWDLKIDYAQKRDSGIYECQVNTEPKINLAVSLEVNAEADNRDKITESEYYDAKAARAKILGSTEIHVKRDSTIALACSVNIHASSVTWYHGASVVDFDSQRGGISLETEKTDVGTTSRLMLTRASLRDSGNYTCVPTGAIPASVRVHVLTGEQPAAMQTSRSNIVLQTRVYLTIATSCIITFAYRYQNLIISQTASNYNMCRRR